MPALNTLKDVKPVKMLLIGDSGSGKTGSLASLARAGYKLRILDFDNGVSILANLLADSPKALANIVYETCTDDMVAVNGRMVPKGQPKAASKGMNLLTEWKIPDVRGPSTKNEKGEVVQGPILEAGYNLGSPTTWGRDTIIVIDSLTMLGEAILRYVAAMNNRVGNLQIQDWGEAMRIQKSVVEMLYSDSIKCNVIVQSHIKFIGKEENDADLRGYPSALGSNLAPQIGRYFNTTIMAKTKGYGAQKKHQLITVSEGRVELKTENPLKVPAELPLETGMATIFESLLGKAPGFPPETK